MIQSVPETMNFTLEEEKILVYWNNIKAFDYCRRKWPIKMKFDFFSAFHSDLREVLICPSDSAPDSADASSIRFECDETLVSMIGQFGTDAVRLALISSRVRGKKLSLKSASAKRILRNCIFPLYNAYRLLIQNVETYEKENGAFRISPLKRLEPTGLDQWILSLTQSLVKFVYTEIGADRFHTVIPKFIEFIKGFTKWHIKLSRKRCNGRFGMEVSYEALETITSVLNTVVRLMAPFVPYLTELIYQNLKLLYNDKSNESVHYLMLPDVQEFLIDEDAERCVSYMQTIVNAVRVVRDRRTMPLKYPLPEAIIICKEQTVLNSVRTMENYILEELNIRRLVLTTEKAKYGVTLKAEPNIKALGMRLRNKSKEVAAAIKSLSESEIKKFVDNPAEFSVCGEILESDDIQVHYTFDELTGELSEQYEAHTESEFLLLLNVQPDSAMLDEGVAREVINRIQKLRKEGKLVPTDAIEVYCNLPGELLRVIKPHITEIPKALQAALHFDSMPADRLLQGAAVVVKKLKSKDARFKDSICTIEIVKSKDQRSQQERNLSHVRDYLSELPEDHCVSCLIERLIGNKSLASDVIVLTIGLASFGTAIVHERVSQLYPPDWLTTSFEDEESNFFELVFLTVLKDRFKLPSRSADFRIYDPAFLREDQLFLQKFNIQGLKQKFEFNEDFEEIVKSLGDKMLLLTFRGAEFAMAKQLFWALKELEEDELAKIILITDNVEGLTSALKGSSEDKGAFSGYFKQFAAADNGVDSEENEFVKAFIYQPKV